MDFKDYYQILGVEPSADSKTIKTAYRKLARQYHPDVSDHPEAEVKFKEISDAYSILSNSEKRANYDQIRQYNSNGQQFEMPPDWQAEGPFQRRDFSQSDSDFSDFISSIFDSGRGSGHRSRASPFSRRQSFSQKGQDIEAELKISLEDSLSSGAKTISYQLPHYENDGALSYINKTLELKIPAGVTDGQRVRLKGQGGKGMGDGPSGDLYCRIRLAPHPLFDVDGHNLIMTVPLAPWEAALGTKIHLPTLSGSIQLTIPAASQTGQRFRIKGKGLRADKGHGDLYAVLKVVMPTTTTKEVQAQWKKLSQTAAFDPRSEWSKTS